MIKQIDFSGLIESLNEDAFDYFRSLVYPACGYRILSVEDIRNIDLIERAFQLSDSYGYNLLILRPFLDFKSSPPETTDLVNSISIFLSSYVFCEAGSRADDYKKRGEEIIKTIRTNSKFNDEDFKFLLIIFLSLVSTLKKKNPNWYLQPKNYHVRDSSFYATIEHGDLLEDIRTNDDWVPAEVISKEYRRNYSKKRKNKDEMGKIHLIKNYYHFLYSLYLSIALQDTGFFSPIGG